MSFRKLQSIMDLRRIAIRHLENCPPASLTIKQELLETLRRSISGRKPNWTLELSVETYQEVYQSVVSADDNAEFLAASCILLLDRFENRSRGSDFEWEWDAFASRYKEANAQSRAAIMNGLDEARKYGFVAAEIRPSVADCTTKTFEDVIRPLREIAKSLTREEREWIATADYGQDADQHLRALNALLETEHCLYPANGTSYPEEVVNLASHSSKYPASIGCTAIMLINAIADHDCHGHADFRWGAHRFSYDALGPVVRSAIHDGFRHIYEVNRDWNPYFDQFAPDRLRTDSFLPL